MPDKPKYSYRFLRNPVSSETEIVQQRQLLRKDTNSTYAKLAYSSKAATLSQMALNHFVRMQPFVGREIERRLEDIKQANEKINKFKKKTAKQIADQATLLAQETELKEQLKSERDEFAEALDVLQKTSQKMELIKAKNVKMTVAMENEMMETFQNHRIIRMDEQKKAVAKKKTAVNKTEPLDAAAVQAAALQEYAITQQKDASKKTYESRLVRKDEIPDGFTPLK